MMLVICIIKEGLNPSNSGELVSSVTPHCLVMQNELIRLNCLKGVYVCVCVFFFRKWCIFVYVCYVFLTSHAGCIYHLHIWSQIIFYFLWTKFYNTRYNPETGIHGGHISNKGKVGGWKSCMTDSVKERVESQIGKYLKHFNYSWS
jgi:hypothetical protein